MKNDTRQPCTLSSQHRASLCALSFLLLVASAACQSGGSTANSEASGVVIINAPATGEVRRVLAREGMTVSEGTPIVEIAVQNETQAPTPTPGESAEARAARNFKTANVEIESARAEAVRHEAEVQRLTPLVSSGEASPAELEGERALYERAQQRLQQAQDAKRKAEGGLLASRTAEQQQPGSIAPPPAPLEQIVTANASSAGTVSVINARVGQRVKLGQPLATLRANQR
jgi:multidrug efflux pump subunit AcrA (membrane-fusion protein)